MVRLAQDFSSRYPLVDGQGNFGNIDGDNPAAYRYTEARMTDVARLLLDGIDEDGVEFRPNYDGQTKEPVVLPGGFPEPARQRRARHRGRHGDLDPAAQRGRALRRRAALIDKPDAQIQGAAEMGQGPGFPDRRHHRRFQGRAIAEAYTTGRGSFRVRARWEQEEGARGTWVVVVTEIPFLVQKSRLIEKIAELLNEKKLPLVGDIRDESAEDVRIVIEPKSRTSIPH